MRKFPYLAHIGLRAWLKNYLVIYFISISVEDTFILGNSKPELEWGNGSGIARAFLGGRGQSVKMRKKEKEKRKKITEKHKKI